MKEEYMKEEGIDKGFISNNNYELISASEGCATMIAHITDTSLNPYSTAHGGFIFGLADTAAGLACNTFCRAAMTVNASIEYLHAVKGNTIKAEAKCIKNGRTISVYEVDVYDESDRIVAKSTITYFYIDSNRFGDNN